MRYTVVWRSSAREELASLWLDANDRRAITNAADRIDQLLAEDPQQKGEEFYGDRLLIESPLIVTFSISEDDRLVRVIQVWRQ